MDHHLEEITARTWITLCHPADPRNVGGVLRVAANFGFKGVRIVTETDFDQRDLLCFSSEASLKVDYRFHRTLDECLCDQHFVIGTTRRQRDPDAPSMFGLPELPNMMPKAGDLAVLFGAERTGLTTSEVDRCQALVWIPTSETFPSMNLAHAVAVVGYQLSQHAGHRKQAPTSTIEPSRLSQPIQEAFFTRVRSNLLCAQYPPGRNPQGYLRRLRRFLLRANPSQQELGLLGGVFAELARLSKIASIQEEPDQK